MELDLFAYPADLWPHVAESAYRRERVAADFAASRRPRGKRVTVARRRAWRGRSSAPVGLARECPSASA